MWILAAILLAIAGVFARRVRKFFGALFWLALIVALLTMYGFIIKPGASAAPEPPSYA